VLVRVFGNVLPGSPELGTYTEELEAVGIINNHQPAPASNKWRAGDSTARTEYAKPTQDGPRRIGRLACTTNVH